MIVGIVFIHSYPTAVAVVNRPIDPGSDHGLSSLVHNFISDGVARISVPVFFAISGFLFFAGFSPSWQGYLQKWRSRVASLLVPFLIWTSIGLLIVWMGQESAAFSRYFSGPQPAVATLGPRGLADLLLGLTGMPVAYQFWFIRDLMLIVAFAPVIHFLVSRFSSPLVAAALVFWFLDWWPYRVPYFDGVMFFYLGAWAAIEEKDLTVFDGNWRVLATVACVLFVGDALTKGMTWNPWLNKTAILVGMGAVIGASGAVNLQSGLARCLLALAPSSFFVFATHEPLVTLLRKLAYRIHPPSGESGALAIYFAQAIIAIAVCLVAHRLCLQLAPRLTRLSTGGR